METKRIQTHGQTMTPPRPRASRAEYQRERRRLLHDLYFPSVEEKARLQALAAVDGFGHDFNAWLLMKLYASLSGNVYPAGYVEGIQSALERVRGWLESAREDAASSAAEVMALRARLEVLLVVVSGASHGRGDRRPFPCRGSGGAAVSIDPQSRMRVETVVVRPSIKTDLTNEELPALFLRSLEGGKVSGGTLERFRGQVREAMRYFRRADGTELPVREWTKEGVWGYVHFVESSLCVNFVQLSFKTPVRALCKADRWQGMMDAETAATVHCAACPVFKRLGEGARKRLGSLNRFFTFLASVGAVPFNFVRDVSKEHSNQNPRSHGGREKKRNPTVAEIVRLVDETSHVRRRAFYAASAKWGCRPNEMVALDRYASFGLPTPEVLPRPHGFENGFPAHPHLKPFNEGGQLVYLPEKRDAAGNPLKDNRTGNRWLVVDAESRPILEQVLADWERRVKRDPKTGLPVRIRSGATRAEGGRAGRGNGLCGATGAWPRWVCVRMCGRTSAPSR